MAKQYQTVKDYGLFQITAERAVTVELQQEGNSNMSIAIWTYYMDGQGDWMPCSSSGGRAIKLPGDSIALIDFIINALNDAKSVIKPRASSEIKKSNSKKIVNSDSEIAVTTARSTTTKPAVVPTTKEGELVLESPELLETLQALLAKKGGKSKKK